MRQLCSLSLWRALILQMGLNAALLLKLAPSLQLQHRSLCPASLVQPWRWQGRAPHSHNRARAHPPPRDRTPLEWHGGCQSSVHHMRSTLQQHGQVGAPGPEFLWEACPAMGVGAPPACTYGRRGRGHLHILQPVGPQRAHSGGTHYPLPVSPSDGRAGRSGRGNHPPEGGAGTSGLLARMVPWRL